MNDNKSSSKNIKSILKPKTSPSNDDHLKDMRAEAVEGDKKKIQFLADTELNKIKFIPEVIWNDPSAVLRTAIVAACGPFFMLTVNLPIRVIQGNANCSDCG